MKQHILIADSDFMVAHLLSELLERSNSNYCTSVVRSGEEALEMLRDSEVDILVADQFAPGISGLELVRRARACSPQTRAILSIVCGDDGIEAKARCLGVFHCLCKPFPPEELRSAVRKALAM